MWTFYEFYEKLGQQFLFIFFSTIGFRNSIDSRTNTVCLLWSGSAFGSWNRKWHKLYMQIRTYFHLVRLFDIGKRLTWVSNFWLEVNYLQRKEVKIGCSKAHFDYLIRFLCLNWWNELKAYFALKLYDRILDAVQYGFMLSN